MSKLHAECWFEKKQHQMITPPNNRFNQDSVPQSSPLFFAGLSPWRPVAIMTQSSWTQMELPPWSFSTFSKGLRDLHFLGGPDQHGSYQGEIRWKSPSFVTIFDGYILWQGIDFEFVHWRFWWISRFQDTVLYYSIIIVCCSKKLSIQVHFRCVHTELHVYTILHLRKKTAPIKRFAIKHVFKSR